jgi:hypothetical protein
MNTVQKFFTISAITLSSMSASAEFIKTDWKEVGDNLAVVDKGTGLEWLNLSQTDGMSISQVDTLLSTTFYGWRFPSRNEVNIAMTSLTGVDAITPSDNVTVKYSEEGVQKAIAYEDALGSTGVSRTQASDNTHYSYGHYYDDPTDLGSLIYFGGVTYYYDNGYMSAVYDDNVRNNDAYTFSHQLYGVYLVSEGGTTLSSINDPSINATANVPLPATTVLLGLGLLGFFAPRKKSSYRLSD